MKNFFLNNKNKILNTIMAILMISLLIQRLPVLLNSFSMTGSKVEAHFISGLEVPPLGQKTALVFWATWCAPCTLELNRIQAAINSHEIEAKKVIAVNLGEKKENAEKVFHQRKYTMIDVYDENGELATAFKVKVTPSIFLIKENREISWATTGVGPTLIYRLKSFFHQ